MTATVRISEKAARAIWEILDSHGLTIGADDLRAAIDATTRRRAKSKPRREAQRKTKATKKEKRADVRALVMARAAKYHEDRHGGFLGWMCEGCQASGQTPATLQLDHFEGRARSESLETCWALCPRCHGKKTDNKPNAAYWLNTWLYHLENHAGESEGYGEAARRAQARLAFVETRSRLTASPSATQEKAP